jgi:transposase
MRFVPLKTDEQLDLQALHRVRDRYILQRTALLNQIRGFLLERGIALRQGPAHLRSLLPTVLEEADLSPSTRQLLAELRDEWAGLEEKIEDMDRKISAVVKESSAVIARPITNDPKPAECTPPITIAIKIAGNMRKHPPGF